MAYKIRSAQIVAEGGTGSTSFTTGSLIFSNGTILTQDNSNLFWDDTENRLGIGTTTPSHDLTVVGHMEIDHTADESGDHALEIECAAGGFGDIKCIDINYVTGAIGGGDSEVAILLNVDETASGGGDLFGVQVLSTGEGTAAVYASRSGVGVNPIIQAAGTFGDADTILVLAVDQTAALAHGGAGNVTTFVADNDTMTVGDAAQFGEIQVIIDTSASGGGIAPTFEFSTGVGTWTLFSPTDGTSGMRNTGSIAFEPDSIPTWVVGTGTEFLIRITRTRNMLNTVPILDEIQISATSTCTWDSTGAVRIVSIAVTDLTQYTLPITGANNELDDLASGLGAAGQVLTSAGAGAEPTWQGGGIPWTDVTGTSASMAVDNGYIANNASLVTLTLPDTVAVGEVVRVSGVGAGGWLIAQNASDIIHFGSTDTTTGAGGSLASTNRYDAVELLCVVANVEFAVLSSLGNITIV